MIRDFATANTPALRSLAETWLSAAPADRPQPAPLRQAATVMIVRDGAVPASARVGGPATEGSAAEGAPAAASTAGVEVFMLRRVASMAFAPSTMVFPGGGVDARDAVALPWAGPGVVQWAARLDADEQATRMLVVAAIREVFEECGVLFASASETGPLVDVSAPEWADVRAGLVARELSLADVLRRHHLVLRTDLLRAHAHWVTPIFESRRFDTRFFVALMPEGRDLDGETSEADHSGWFAPTEVLDDFAAGRAVLLPPTQVCLEQLAESATAAAFFARAPVIRRLAPTLAVTDAGEIVLRVDSAGSAERTP